MGREDGAATGTQPAGSLGISLPLGPAWFRLPVGSGGQPADLERQIEGRIDREPPLANRSQALLDMLVHFRDDARRRRTVAAALLGLPDDLDGAIVATLYVSLCERTSVGPVGPYLDALEAKLATRQPTDRTDRAVDRRELHLLTFATPNLALTTRLVPELDTIAERVEVTT